MRQTKTIRQTETPVFNTLVVGTGAAGYAAACRLREAGVSVAILTEGVTDGTSRNAGSDKQTYYKLGLSGSAPDSVRKMADDLFFAGAVDGDTALCESACSVRAFSYLCEAGVAFPHTVYGEYVGYKTDHDPCARATSAGPLTSHDMVECLARRAGQLGIPVFDRLYVIRILTDEEGVAGVLCLDRDTSALRTFCCAHVILATGGPATLYADSVYPLSQSGASSLAPMAGACMQNLTEWQYGLASLSPRWNVSGTYMQVLPRLLSVGDDGEREFLSDIFDDPYLAMSALFLKGYQWPFDAKRALDGSSLIDLAVYRETVMQKRRVYLDYTKNPFGLVNIDFEKLVPEAREYLASADACFGTPIQRLSHMNKPAVELYQSKGVDLACTPLEIALCAQHCNGGVAVDADWRTSVDGLYAVGEVAGTHGIARPGGSALNAGQVGALRAADSIARSRRVVRPLSPTAARMVDAEASLCHMPTTGDSAVSLLSALRHRMSDVAGPVRQREGMAALLSDVHKDLASLSSLSGTAEEIFRLRDALVTAALVLSAMLDYTETVGTSRGSALYLDPTGECPHGLDGLFPHRTDPRACADRIQSVSYGPDHVTHATWRPVRPIPPEETVFETVWREDRARREKC